MEEDYDQRILVDHGEWCLGYGSETWMEVRSVFHVDLQDQVYKARFVVYLRKVDYGMTYSIDETHFSSEAEVFIEQRATCAEKTLYELRRHT